MMAPGGKKPGGNSLKTETGYIGTAQNRLISLRLLIKCDKIQSADIFSSGRRGKRQDSDPTGAFYGFTGRSVKRGRAMRYG